MKAYGYPLTSNVNNCFGIVIDENNKFIGSHTSSNYSFLEQDLKYHAKDYDFEFVNMIPQSNFIISILMNEIYRLKEVLENKE